MIVIQLCRIHRWIYNAIFQKHNILYYDIKVNTKINNIMNSNWLINKFL